jgi:hypothetical protein
MLATVLIAIFASIFVSASQSENRMYTLLHSSSTADQLQGIQLLHKKSFDTCLQQVSHLLTSSSDASVKAQELIAQKAFREKRVEELLSLQVESSLVQSLLWWTNPPPQERVPLLQQSQLQNSTIAPWLRKLSYFYAAQQDEESILPLEPLPIRDRDGSVLLMVLATYANTQHDFSDIIETWSSSYDVDAQKAALLLHALLGNPTVQIPSHDLELQTIYKILHERDTMLAWRSMHRDDGSIRPDIVLAGMIANPDTFTPTFIETAKHNHWVHPEHPIIIASTFFPETTTQIPSKYRISDESRKKWWDLFSCGLLLEGR